MGTRLDVGPRFRLVLARFRLVRPRFRVVGRLLETKAGTLVSMKLWKASRILLVALPLRLEVTMGRRTLQLLVCACESDGSRVVRAQESTLAFFLFDAGLLFVRRAARAQLLLALHRR